MTQQAAAQTGANWKMFLSKHWRALASFISAGTIALIGAVYVFLWFTGQAQASGLVPDTLGLWSMGNLVTFLLHALFWELLIVGVPVAVGAVIGWQWWRRLPEEEKRSYNFGGQSKSRNAGGVVSSLFLIAFALKVYADGNWNVAISTYTLNYVVASMATILVWVAAIAAVTATIGFIWWIHREMNKNP